MSLKFLGSLSLGLGGTGTRAAVSVSWPYVSRRPVGGCRTAPFSAVQAAGSTPHWRGPPPTGHPLAAPPARRRGEPGLRTRGLPPVGGLPPKGGVCATL